MNKLTNTKEFRLKLYPKDFYATKEFYENILGFPIVHNWGRENSKGVMFNTGSAIIELIWPVVEGGLNYSKDNGVNLSLEVTDVESLWEVLKDNSNIAYGLKHNDWGDTSFGVYDPNGFRITFFTID